jgi:hypothetical protein
MDRREALGLVGATAIASAAFGQEKTTPPGGALPATPPRITAEQLAARVKEKGFEAKSLYAHEVEFVGIVKIKRDVPLLEIKGMDGPYSQVHLYGSGGNVDVGKELTIVGLIVDHGFGALMMWKREWKYVDAELNAVP